MPIIDSFRVIRSLRKTPVLLKVMLNGVTQERASQSWDGDWNAERDYVHQQLAAEFETYLATRQRLLAVLLALTPDQWQRYGTHPEFGTITIVEMGANIALHDINHIEQMARVLGLAESIY